MVKCCQQKCRKKLILHKKGGISVKKVLSILMALVLLMSCMSFALADDKPVLTVWIPVY